MHEDYFHPALFSYETVGNSFSLIEITAPLSSLPPFLEKAKLICKEKGTHGLLLVLPQEKWCAVYNKDGSYGQFSINGARCAAFHLITHHHLTTPFVLKVGAEKVDILQSDELLGVGKKLGTLGKSFQVSIQNHLCTVQEVEVGNPHAIVQIPHSLYTQFEGDDFLIETTARHLMKNFQEEKNVSFFTQTSLDSFSILFYERGVGCTPCCGSAILAITTYAIAWRKSFFLCFTRGGIVKIIILKNKNKKFVNLQSLAKVKLL